MPAILQVIRNFENNKEPKVGSIIHLEAEITTLGRRPTCAICLPPESVSKDHAWILCKNNGQFALEDRNSRNSTFLNGEVVPPLEPVLLTHKDHIRVCDFEALFLDLDQMENSSLEAALTPYTDTLLETQPSTKLRILLEISATLAKARKAGAVPPALAECLFRLFRQADRCFLILVDDSHPGKKPPALRTLLVQTRDPNDESQATFSRTIVHHCLETTQSLLVEDRRDIELLLVDNQSFLGSGIRSAMYVPLCNSEGRPFGVIQLDTQNSGKKFSKDDLELLTGVANQAAIALENARLLESEKIQSDLKTARTVLECFLPSEFPEVSGYEFAAYYQPAQSVGGDYYGFLPMPDGRLMVALGDVAGKGISAALLVAKLSSEMAACALRETDPADLMTSLNTQMYPFTNPMHRFVTLALARLDPYTHQHTLVNAGHEIPLVYQPSSGSLTPAMNKHGGGYPVGIEMNATYTGVNVNLNPGEILLIYSDGVTEAGSRNGTPFRTQRVQQAVHGLGATGPRELIQAIVQAVRLHAGEGPPDDDIAVLAVKRTV